MGSGVVVQLLPDSRNNWEPYLIISIERLILGKPFR
jgi:hypothetical protein